MNQNFAFTSNRKNAFTIPEALLAITLFALAAAVLVQAMTNADLAISQSTAEDRYSQQALVQILEVAEREFREQGLTRGRLNDHPLLGSVEWEIRTHNWNHNLVKLETTLATGSGMEEQSTTVYYMSQ